MPAAGAASASGRNCRGGVGRITRNGMPSRPLSSAAACAPQSEDALAPSNYLPKLRMARQNRNHLDANVACDCNRRPRGARRIVPCIFSTPRQGIVRPDASRHAGRARSNGERSFMVRCSWSGKVPGGVWVRPRRTPLRRCGQASLRPASRLNEHRRV